MADKLIYIVVISDESTVAVFDSKQTAEDYAREYSKRYSRSSTVEEWILNGEAGKKCLSIYRCYLNVDTGVFNTMESGMELICGDRIRVDKYRREIIVTSPVSEEHAAEVAKKKRQEILELEAQL
jgi:hypothetical protein